MKRFKKILKFFRNYFLFICSFISLGFVENEKIYASPRESYKSASICRHIRDAEFLEYKKFKNDVMNYYCIDKKTNLIIKKVMEFENSDFLSGKFVNTELLGKLNQPDAEFIPLNKYGWKITEYTIEGTGKNRILVEYYCWSDDSFECDTVSQRVEIGVHHYHFIPKKFLK